MPWLTDEYITTLCMFSGLVSLQDRAHPDCLRKEIPFVVKNGGMTIQMWLDGWPQCDIPYLPCGTVFLLSLLVVVMVVGFWQG